MGIITPTKENGMCSHRRHRGQCGEKTEAEMGVMCLKAKGTPKMAGNHLELEAWNILAQNLQKKPTLPTP